MLSSPSLCNNNEPFLDWIVTWDEKWILYDNQRRPAQWLDKEETLKYFPKPSESCSVVSNSLRPHVLHSPWNSPGQNTGVGSHSLLQGIFPTQGSSCIAANSLPAEPPGKLLKAKFAPKKGHGHCSVCSAASLTHYSFLNPSETITFERYAQQIDEMHWKLQCLQPALVIRKGPILLHDNARSQVTQPTLQLLNQHSKAEWIGLWSFASSDLLITDYHFFKHLDNFLQGKCFQK